MRVVIIKKKDQATDCISVHNDISEGKEKLLQIASELDEDNVVNKKGVFSRRIGELFYKRRKTSFEYDGSVYKIIGFNALKTYFKNVIPEDVKEMILAYYPNEKFI